MQILIAEDDRTSRNILNVVLTRLGYDVIAVADGAAAWKVLQRPDAPKLVILDWVMPGMEGIEICTRLRRISDPETSYTYVILLTAKGSKENIIMGMDAGADDYVVKPFDHNELRVRIRAGQRIVDLQSELYAVKKELLLQSRTDPLTGILNRRALMPLIAKECSRSLRSKASFALSMLDIDHFKKINDTYGHSAGDAVLKEIVNRINAVIRPYDPAGTIRWRRIPGGRSRGQCRGYYHRKRADQTAHQRHKSVRRPVGNSGYGEPGYCGLGWQVISG